MKYCNSCVLPESRPNLYILANGICTACKSHRHKKKINWKKKENNFRELVKKIKKKNYFMIV